MASTIALAIAGLAFYWIYSNISGLYRNIAAAKRSGLPYIIARKSPLAPVRVKLTTIAVNIYNTAWLITHKIWVRFFSYLPGILSESWLPYVPPLLQNSSGATNIEQLCHA